MWDRFLRACRREKVDVTPVWFMRQAGRYMAEYRAIRAKNTLVEICKQPALLLVPDGTILLYPSFAGAQDMGFPVLAHLLDALPDVLHRVPRLHVARPV